MAESLEPYDHGQPLYKVNTKVLCRHTDNLYYDTKIVGVERSAGQFVYTVHYQGWSKRYDEKIPQNMTYARFREYTPQNIEKAKLQREMKEAQQRERESASSRSTRRSNNKSSTNSDRRNWCTPLGATSTASTSTNDEGSSERASSFPCEGLVPKLEEPSENDDDARSVKSTPTIELVDNQIWVTGKLKSLLDIDKNKVENELKLPKLPAKSSVAKIIKDYVDSVHKMDVVLTMNMEQHRENDKSRRWKLFVASLDECALGMQDFFDCVVATNILRENEKLRYQDSTSGSTAFLRHFISSGFSGESSEGLRASECYGFIYLVRLLAQFQTVITYMPCDEDSRELIRIFTRGFVKFLTKNADKLFNEETDYVPITVDYQRRLAAWSASP